MRGSMRFVVPLVLGLGLLALAGDAVLTRTMRRWFEHDLSLRSRLAVGAARQTLAARWRGDPTALTSALDDITRDERIMGAAACDATGALRAATEAFPAGVTCAELMAARPGDDAEAEGGWALDAGPAGGRVRVGVVPLRAGGEALGAVALVHDVRFMARREETTRGGLVGAFFVLAACAAAVTLLAARAARAAWIADLRRSLKGEVHGEFAPLVGDVRALAETLSQERSHEALAGAWSADRLREALRQNLFGERVVILANREPYIHERGDDGALRVLHPASGLVTALEPVMRACSGVWVAHGSGSADRETVDAHDRLGVPPGAPAYQLRRVWLSPDEEQGYYYGFSNEGLWPLCHVAHARPEFRAEDWEHYVAVNRRFADAVCDEVDADDPIILVQDYHFALAPRMIRERLPRATIITFWHIPWPNAERIGICPWREELLAGLLGSSVVGFHTRQHCNHFIDAVDAYMESRIDREAQAVVQGARRTLVRPYPISIEWPVRRLDAVPAVPVARASVRAELGLAPDALLGVGIDRLDYTKRIEERLAAVDEMLRRHPSYRGRFTFVQLAAPSRTKIPRYRELNDRVEALVAEVNARWATDAWKPLVLLRAHHEPEAVFRYYRAAELCYVSSLHDGMNLVAKEFVAARDDERGVLVLSQFTGAARDLPEALVVNPYDLRQAADALAAALAMVPDEQRERMRAMRRFVAEFNVYRWAGRMLLDAAELRRRERLLGRFGGADRAGAGLRG